MHPKSYLKRTSETQARSLSRPVHRPQHIDAERDMLGPVVLEEDQ